MGQPTGNYKGAWKVLDPSGGILCVPEAEIFDKPRAVWNWVLEKGLEEEALREISGKAPSTFSVFTRFLWEPVLTLVNRRGSEVASECDLYPEIMEGGR